MIKETIHVELRAKAILTFDVEISMIDTPVSSKICESRMLSTKAVLVAINGDPTLAADSTVRFQTLQRLDIEKEDLTNAKYCAEMQARQRLVRIG